MHFITPCITTGIQCCPKNTALMHACTLHSDSSRSFKIYYPLNMVLLLEPNHNSYIKHFTFKCFVQIISMSHKAWRTWKSTCTRTAMHAWRIAWQWAILFNNCARGWWFFAAKQALLRMPVLGRAHSRILQSCTIVLWIFAESSCTKNQWFSFMHPIQDPCMNLNGLCMCMILEFLTLHASCTECMYRSITAS